MISLTDFILKKELDPFYLTNTLISKGPDGECPPMAKYFRTELDALLFQLLTSHRIYDVDNKPITDGAYISSKALEQLKGSISEYDKNPMAIVSATYKSSYPQKKQHSKPRTRHRSRSRHRSRHRSRNKSRR